MPTRSELRRAKDSKLIDEILSYFAHCDATGETPSATWLNRAVGVLRRHKVTARKTDRDYEGAGNLDANVTPESATEQFDGLSRETPDRAEDGPSN